jgi:hypothetical protein
VEGKNLTPLAPPFVKGGKPKAEGFDKRSVKNNVTDDLGYRCTWVNILPNRNSENIKMREIRTLSWIPMRSIWG